MKIEYSVVLENSAGPWNIRLEDSDGDDEKNRLLDGLYIRSPRSPKYGGES